MEWTEARLSIERLDLTDAQKANALELLAVAEGLTGPQEISLNDYDGGLSLHWSRFEVAVYDDHFETYRLDRDTRIEHWPHLPDEPFPPALADELRRAAS
jgi:hypothetical protein